MDTINSSTRKASLLTYERIPAYLGLILLVSCYAAVVSGQEWVALQHLHNNGIAQQITGYLLFFAILWQWRLYYARINLSTQKAREVLFTHRNLGVAFSPLFIVHASSLGYGLLAILSVAYFLVMLSGILGPTTLPWRNKYYLSSWLTLHVLSAATVVILTVYHLYIVYWYS